MLSSNEPAGEETEGVKAFFDQWALYVNGMENNCLFHREAYAALRQLIKDRFNGLFSMLDLGCGDARFMSGALKGTAVASYHGVDLSEVALSFARKNLKGAGYRKIFTVADFTEFVRGAREETELIWIGLSLHHLPRPQKEIFAKDCRGLLKKDGCLVVYEPSRLEDETREEFLVRWERMARSEWKALSAEEIDAIYRHVAVADYPESLSGYQEVARGAGFGKTELIFTTPNGIYRLLCFS